ncbi:uncharacterized protein LOC133322127 [Musca vetustissima]|uniref:uncharacterized protein LOC133322127 n=1 Tax=Musca vetustissima TaxID=27455 RepID=UPI002AB6EED7|nr:uncharacterized protein LOC133322127 [Musca vetustissima]
MTDLDPWKVQHPENSNTNGTVTNGTNNTTESENASLGFEDSFIAEAENNNCDSDKNEQEKSNTTTDNQKPEHQPLPDSQTYLKGLERKLDKLKKNSKLVEALSEKRDDCLRSLIQSDLSGNNSNNDLMLELEASINSDSAVHNLYRQIQPVQAVTVGETVHIVKYDQLEEQRLEADAEEDGELPASR